MSRDSYRPTSQTLQIRARLTGEYMEHENFPVAGFEFMDEPATDEQKAIIIDMCKARGIPIDPNGEWPTPFTKWDAGNMIETLKSEGQVRKQG